MTEDAPRRLAYMPLSQILPAARNPKQHDEQGLRHSIGRFGLADLPVLDERTGRLVSGHGRINDLAARSAEGDDPPDGVTVSKKGEWLVPVVRGWSSANDSEAEAYIITANKLTINGAWDDRQLAEMLNDLVAVDQDLATVTGFDMGELDDLLLLLEPPPTVHETVPATGARYAETEEQMTVRSERIAAYQPAVDRAGGFTEVILVYPQVDRDEVGRLVEAARTVLGAELRAADIVLRSLRVLVAVMDGRHDTTPIELASLARHAGWTGGE